MAHHILGVSVLPYCHNVNRGLWRYQRTYDMWPTLHCHLYMCQHCKYHCIYLVNPENLKSSFNIYLDHFFLSYEVGVI